MMWMPLRAPKMKLFIFGFQRLVWCPKWTPASIISRMVMGASLGEGWVPSGGRPEPEEDGGTDESVAVMLFLSRWFPPPASPAAVTRDLRARAAASTGVWFLWGVERAGGFYHKSPPARREPREFRARMAKMITVCGLQPALRF